MRRNGTAQNRIASGSARRYPAGGRGARTAAAYVDGNTVRKADPYEYPAKEHRTSVRNGKKAAQRIHSERENALSMDIPYLLLLTVAVLATLFLCYRYLSLQSSVNTHMDTVEALQQQLETLKTENDALESSIDTSVDLNYIYNVAVNELGMVHAGKDSIINFDKTESEYVRQYEDIPKQ